MEKAWATFPALVDRRNSVGELYGFRAVPNGILVNEDGTLFRRFGGGFDIRREATEDLVRAWLERRQPRQEPPEQESVGPPEEAARLFREGTALYEDEKIREALALWRQAWALDQENWVIRKQVWAVENPDRFYVGPVDYTWQQEQIGKGL